MQSPHQQRDEAHQVKKTPNDPHGYSVPGRPAKPAGWTVVAIPPTVPETIIEEDDDGIVTPAGQAAAAVVDTGSVFLGDSFAWLGTNDGLDYEFGHSDCDAMLAPSAPVHLNASVSSYAVPPSNVDRSLSSGW